MISFPTRLVAGTVLVTAFAAAIGGWVGIQYGLRETHPAVGLDEVLHQELRLTAEQQRRITDLESQFAAKRMSLEDEMKVANRELADAILAEHTYGPRSTHAIERFHSAMGTLQEETIKHILAMRGVLTPEQASQFDRTVSKALAPDQP
jgi:Spy/CpxP family protein refolding chaperone